jgi:hypothetical protein
MTRRRCFWRSSGVAGNKGANTPGVDGVTAAWVEEQMGVPGFLENLSSAARADEEVLDRQARADQGNVRLHVHVSGF